MGVGSCTSYYYRRIFDDGNIHGRHDGGCSLNGDASITAGGGAASWTRACIAGNGAGGETKGRRGSDYSKSCIGSSAAMELLRIN